MIYKIEEKTQLPIEEWYKEALDLINIQAHKRAEEEEKQEYERLKNKFGT